MCVGSANADLFANFPIGEGLQTPSLSMDRLGVFIPALLRSMSHRSYDTVSIGVSPESR